MVSPAAATGYDAPVLLSLVRRGAIIVQVATTDSVLRGDKGYYNGTTGTWRNDTTDSHVLVENSQWQTSGSGTQRVYVNFPSSS